MFIRDLFCLQLKEKKSNLYLINSYAHGPAQCSITPWKNHGYLIRSVIPCVKKSSCCSSLRYLRYGTKLHQPQSIRRVLSLYRKNEKKKPFPREIAKQGIKRFLPKT
ncbi:hypothetical protein CEXT_48681 [Caerostris extrusa]|uniref:Uncharacterized protein n=1 Tax=Caerostris extrusa TaxID=172846 RepID=A0AAV4NNV6_CAEEX|nr:hypothetical protein CEXT_48681 [Caerostris extrusa]